MDTPSAVDPMSPLAATAVALAAARDTLDACKSEVKTATDEFNLAHGEKFKLVKAAAENVLSLEASLRALTISAFEQSGSKEPLPGLGIREETVVSWDNQEEVEKVCREKGLFLSVDFGALEKAAAASPASFPFVKVTKVAKATIAKDLTKTLEAVSRPAAGAAGAA